MAGTYFKEVGLNLNSLMNFIEIGNIRNTRDQKRILDPDNRQALANWICEGIILDYETH